MNRLLTILGVWLLDWFLPVLLVLGIGAVIWCCALARGQSLPMAAPDTNNYPSVTLSWNPMTNQIVAGFNIYYGGKSGVYTNKTRCGTNTSLAIYDLPAGAAYYFAATTYSAAGAESALSAEVSWTNYLRTLTNQIVQIWRGTNLLFTTNNPHGNGYFALSNGTLLRLAGTSQNYLGTNRSRIFTTLRITNIPQFQITP